MCANRYQKNVKVSNVLVYFLLRKKTEDISTLPVVSNSCKRINRKSTLYVNLL